MDDWDDNTTSTSSNYIRGVASEGGRKFTAGRGFSAAQADADDGWGSSNAGKTEDSGWNDGPSDNYSNNKRGSRGGGFRGRGEGRGRSERRGGRRGGGGRGGRGDYENGWGGNENKADDDWGTNQRDKGGWRGNKNDDGDWGSNKNDGGGWSSNKNDGGSWGEKKNDGGGWGDSNDGGGWGDSNDGDSWGGRDNDRRGRGERGGGRGRGRGGFDNKGEGDGNFGAKTADEKPRENYVPPERATDEELFTSTITSGINFDKLDDIEVNVSGEDVPPPISSFELSGLRSHLLENIRKSKYDVPTPIQKYAIPIILNKRDLMGCAQTGSGKTAAFLLPIIHTLLESQNPPVTEGNCSQPNVVIVSPTRELAIQIYDQARKFALNSIVRTVVAYGGTSVSHQRNHVLSGCHILVATPGRLNDFVKRGHVSFASVQFFVLDEADRMLDMGFLQTVEEMMENSSMVATGERQTLMFSATFPEEIQHLAAKFLHNYIFVAVGIIGSASTDVQQIFHQVSKFDKREKLLELLREENIRTVVFVETKRNADFLATLLSENDIKTTSIHGDRLQREREQALWDFKKGICNTIVATGVAARGLDIEGIQHVINYDLPNSIDEYVHRIGRTGRVGNKGKATSFFDSSRDGVIAGGLTKILKQAGQEVPEWLASGDFSSSAQRDSFGGRDVRGGDFGAINTQPVVECEEW